MNDKKIALVTGANRGIGLETAKQLAYKGNLVVLTARNTLEGEKRTNDLHEQGLSVTFHTLDVNDPSSIDTLYQWLDKTYGRLDILINNAGVLLERGEAPIDKKVLLNTFETNVVGPYLMTERAIDLMAVHHYGRIVNVTSHMGQLSSMQEDFAAYRISKTALNAVTRIFAAAAKGKNILVNSVCPGWARTDMGGFNAPLTVEQAADTIVWAAELPDRGPTGKFFQKRKEMEW